MFMGKFKNYPGIRLYVTVSGLRQATPAEIQCVQARIASLKWTKGCRLIWSDFSHVRDIQVHAFKWAEYPQMMPDP